MADEWKRDDSAGDSGESEARGISDRVRRAMAAGIEAATRSKDDLLRAASAEIGSWLDRIDVQRELVKALSKMVVEVKAEIRFHPREDGTLKAEATTKIDVANDGKP